MSQRFKVDLDTQLSDSIAILSLSARLPGAHDLKTFWQNLAEGKESITRFSEEQAPHADTPYVKAHGVITDIEQFDAAFFEMSPQEAAVTDPQQRLFLEVAWEALEAAGYAPDKYPGSIGVFAGMTDSRYLHNNLLKNKAYVENHDLLEQLIATSSTYLSTKTSYKLNLKGPSLNITTACSTSLVAVITACRHLLNYECDMAIAGAVSINVPQSDGYAYQAGGIISPDGHCRAFDEKAQGTVFSNGVGAVVLKRLHHALEDGDHIDAIILGSAINNDGGTKVGFTAPSVSGQMHCVAEAIASAEISARDISYVEAHGTSTKLGDPIEVQALTKAFSATTDQKQFCALGSVKTNIGHLDSAAGMAGLMKTVLAMQHHAIPPTLHFTQANPNIDFVNSPFYVNDKLIPWDVAHDAPRRAGVSSFGVGGTNAHLILQEAPEVEASSPSRASQMLLLSAKTQTALDKLTQNLSAYLQETQMGSNSPSLADVAFTLQVGRQDFKYRRAVICHNLEAAVAQLEQHDCIKTSCVDEKAQRPQTVFMFPGQGAQYVGMGATLYQSEPVFKEAIDRCCALLKTHMGMDLRTLLFHDTENAQSVQIEQTRLAQPALFVIEYALATLFLRWGIRPQAMIGHSVGEYVAAHLAGVFSLEDALMLIAERGRLVSQLETGSMLAITAAAEDVAPLLGDALSLAAINAPHLCVVSGNDADISRLEGEIAEKHAWMARRLHTSHAFHSHMMTPALQAFGSVLARVDFHAPKMPYIANVTGQWADETVTSPDYWLKHLRETVQFSKGVTCLLDAGYSLFVELGPGSILSTLIEQHQTQGAECIHTLPSANSAKKASEENKALPYAALSALWLHGIPIDTHHYYQHEKRRRVPLPTYPFERQRHWIEPSEEFEEPARESNASYEDWFYQPTWVREASLLPDRLQKTHFEKGRAWLIFDNGTTLGNAIIETLTHQKQTVVCAKAHSCFEQLGGQAYGIDPASKDDYQSLMNAIKPIVAPNLKILHLWNTEACHGEQFLGFYSLLFLSQACKADAFDKVDVTVVSTGVHKVLDNDKVVPGKATLLGPCRVIPKEQPFFSFHSVDLDDALENYAEPLLHEFGKPSDNASQIAAYRAGYRWAQQISSLPRLVHHTRPLPTQAHNVYLITGGLGGIGLTFAQWLAENNPVRLVLTTRQAFPVRENWETYLTKTDEKDAVADTIVTLKQLEGLGTEILVLQADVADPHAMQTLYDSVREKWGDVNGIIHAAGIAGGGLSQLKTVDQATAVLAPKVQGTAVLANLFKETPLDFVALCSSLYSVTAVPGQIDYCAANACLDAFPQSEAFPQAKQVVSIGWNHWRDVGIGAKSHHTNQFKSLGSDNNISPAEGKQILADVLQSHANHVLVSVFPPQRHQENVLKQAKVEHEKPSAMLEDKKAEHPAKPAIKSIFENETQGVLAELFCTILGVKMVSASDSFFDLGGHSLFALRLLSEIEKIFNVKLNLPVIYEANSVSALAKIIDAPKEGAAHSPLVTLQPAGEKQALFLVHPVGGTVFCYLELAKQLGAGRPCYALQDPDLEHDTLTLKTISDMAAHYIVEIKRVQPTGPYLLGGLSFGGCVAMEMAHQLLTAGEKVTRVVLIDSWVTRDQKIDRAAFEVSMREQQQALADQLAQVNPPDEQDHLDLQWQRLQLLRDYQPAVMTAPVTLFKAQALLPVYANMDDPYNHWAPYVSGAIECHRVPGNHDTLLQLPHIKVLATKLNQILTEDDLENIAAPAEAA